jgi:hypothetical protein
MQPKIHTTHQPRRSLLKLISMRKNWELLSICVFCLTIVIIQNGWYKTNVLEPLLSNFALEYVIKRAQDIRREWKLLGHIRNLVYADDTDLFGIPFRIVCLHFSYLEIQTLKCGSESWPLSLSEEHKLVWILWPTKQPRKKRSPQWSWYSRSARFLFL